MGASVEAASPTVKVTGVFDTLPKDVLSGMSGSAQFAGRPSTKQLSTLINLAVCTHLNGQIREVKTVQELQFLSVNETRRLIPYDNAFLLRSPSF